MPEATHWLSARRLTALAVVTVALLVFLYVFVLPALAARVADRVPLEWEEQLGADLAEMLAPESVRCDDPERVEALERIVGRLTEAHEVGPYDFRLTIVDDTLVNAVAAPGGYVVVFRGLLDRAESAEAVAGVLAHEMQHVIQRHGTTAVLKDLPMILASTVVSGGSQTAGSLLGAAATLGSLRYRRDDEAEADLEGLAMLRTARISPDGMIGFFAALAEDEDEFGTLTSYLSTHPRSQERMEALQSAVAGAPYDTEPLLQGMAWSRMQGPCGGA